MRQVYISFGQVRKLELRVRINIRYELNTNFATQVRRLLNNSRLRVRTTAKAGDLAEHVIQRHEQKAETEHRDGHYE